MDIDDDDLGGCSSDELRGWSGSPFGLPPDAVLYSTLGQVRLWDTVVGCLNSDYRTNSYCNITVLGSLLTLSHFRIRLNGLPRSPTLGPTVTRRGLP